MQRKSLLLGLISALAIMPSLAQAASTRAWGGVSASPDAWYSYLGGTHAVRGDIYKDDWMVRGSVGYGNYDYDTTAVASGNVDIDVAAADLMVGYQHYFATGAGANKGRVTLYGGADFQDHGLDTLDTSNSVRGSQWGVKGLLEVIGDLTAHTSADVTGAYSTSFDSYWSRARIGYDVGGVRIGPEGVFLGNEEFDQQRAGLFFDRIAVGDNVWLSVSGGYSAASRRGDDGAYGDIGFALDF